MAKVSLGAIDLKKLSKGATDSVKKISLGSTLVWQDEIGDVVHSYALNDAVRSELASLAEWFDRAYGGSTYATDLDGAYQANSTTVRPMNIYYNNIPLPNLLQWATVEVVSPPSSDSEGVGVYLRGADTTGLVIAFGTTTARIRSGTTNGTGTGTLFATFNLSSQVVAGDVVGAKITGSPESATITLLRNGEELASYTAQPTNDAYFSGIHITSSSANSVKVKNFKAGSLDISRKNLGVTRTNTFALTNTSTWEKITGWVPGADTNLVNDEIVIPKTGPYKVTLYGAWDAASGTQLIRITDALGTSILERASGNGAVTLTTEVTLQAGTSLKYEGYATNSLRKTLQSGAYITVQPI